MYNQPLPKPQLNKQHNTASERIVIYERKKVSSIPKKEYQCDCGFDKNCGSWITKWIAGAKDFTFRDGPNMDYAVVHPAGHFDMCILRNRHVRNNLKTGCVPEKAHDIIDTHHWTVSWEAVFLQIKRAFGGQSAAGILCISK